MDIIDGSKDESAQNILNKSDHDQSNYQTDEMFDS